MWANQSKSIAKYARNWIIDSIPVPLEGKQISRETWRRGGILVNCVSLPFKCVCPAIELPNVSHKTQRTSRNWRTCRIWRTPGKKVAEGHVSLTPVAYVRPRGALKATNRFKLFTYANTNSLTHENTLEFLLARKTFRHWLHSLIHDFPSYFCGISFFISPLKGTIR